MPHGVVGLAVVSGFVAEQPGVDQDLGRLAGLPVFVQHGRDDDVVPAFFAEDLVTALDAAGADVVTDWRDMGHERTPGSVAALGEWALPLGGAEV